MSSPGLFPSEHSLVAACLASDEGAWRYLKQTYEPQLLRDIAKLLGPLTGFLQLSSRFYVHQGTIPVLFEVGSNWAWKCSATCMLVCVAVTLD